MKKFNSSNLLYTLGLSGVSQLRATRTYRLGVCVFSDMGKWGYLSWEKLSMTHHTCSFILSDVGKCRYDRYVAARTSQFPSRYFRFRGAEVCSRETKKIQLDHGRNVIQSNRLSSFVLLNVSKWRFAAWKKALDTWNSIRSNSFVFPHALLKHEAKKKKNHIYCKQKALIWTALLSFFSIKETYWFDRPPPDVFFYYFFFLEEKQMHGTHPFPGNWRKFLTSFTNTV